MIINIQKHPMFSAVVKTDVKAFSSVIDSQISGLLMTVVTTTRR